MVGMGPWNADDTRCRKAGSAWAESATRPCPTNATASTTSLPPPCRPTDTSSAGLVAARRLQTHRDSDTETHAQTHAHTDTGTDTERHTESENNAPAPSPQNTQHKHTQRQRVRQCPAPRLWSASSQRRCTWTRRCASTQNMALMRLKATTANGRAETLPTPSAFRLQYRDPLHIFFPVCFFRGWVCVCVLVVCLCTLAVSWLPHSAAAKAAPWTPSSTCAPDEASCSQGLAVGEAWGLPAMLHCHSHCVPWLGWCSARCCRHFL